MKTTSLDKALAVLKKRLKLPNREDFVAANFYMADGSWADHADRAELAAIKKLIQPRWLAISSESDGEEFKAWEMLEKFFGHQVYNSHIPKITPIKKDGIKAFTSGEMAWTIFISPEDFQTVQQMEAQS